MSTKDKDIFDLAMPAPSTSSNSTQATATAPMVPAKSTLRLVHFAGAAVLATCVWIAWPFVAGSSESDARVVERTSLTNHAQTTGLAALPSHAEISIDERPEAPPAPQPTQRELELESLLEGLQAKLANIETQISRCTTPAVDMPRTPTQKVRPPGSAATSKSAEPVTLKDFAINTVYRNQAWVSKGERTYVVQPGDVIDGIRIVNIDAQSRQVVTDQGVIR